MLAYDLPPGKLLLLKLCLPLYSLKNGCSMAPLVVIRLEGSSWSI